MIRAVLEQVQGLAFLPVIGLLLFFAVFTGMAVYAIQLRKPFVQHMGNLPLDDGDALASGESK